MDFEKYELTEEQLKAAKAVYRAMRRAAKLNIQFWDDYGTLSCFNGNKIKAIQPDKHDAPNAIDIRNEYDVTYNERLTNIHNANADDDLYAVPREGD